ncbi:MAG: protein-disulfide reductase DsbD N-terminal domain-containing protein [Phycisphaerales bacterium]|nr:protein-disulfide reductase DsbD N-terminal domain-containing protein [Phycisphaerales bacterium]
MQSAIHTMNTALQAQTLTRTAAMLLCLLTSSKSVMAQPNFDQQLITSSLRASADPAPGSEFILAVDLSLEDHWHTYWPGINDTGYGVTFDISADPTLSFGEPYFPAPKRYLAPGQILDHTYEGTLRVLIPVSVSSEAQPGDRPTIEIVSNALVCDDVCIPQTTTATTSVLITDYPVTHYQELIDAYSTRAKRLVDPDVEWSASDSTHSAMLRVKGASRYQFFPSDACTQPADLIKQGDTRADTLTITFDQSYSDPGDPIRFAGRLRVLIGEEWQEYDIDESTTP